MNNFPPWDRLLLATSGLTTVAEQTAATNSHPHRSKFRGNVFFFFVIFKSALKFIYIVLKFFEELCWILKGKSSAAESTKK